MISDVWSPKKSGAAGGFIEKIAAAKNKNIPVYIVGQSV